MVGGEFCWAKEVCLEAVRYIDDGNESQRLVIGRELRYAEPYVQHLHPSLQDSEDDIQP